MQKKNQGQTAPLKKRKYGWRHLLRERTWAALNIIVGVSMLTNVSSFASLAPKAAWAAPASVWTTRTTCTTPEPQDENEYSNGEWVHVRGSNFLANTTYYGTVSGQPGGASADPNEVVKEFEATTDADGGFCVDAYLVGSDGDLDDGVYTVDVYDNVDHTGSSKNDNYHVNAVVGSLTVNKVVDTGSASADSFVFEIVPDPYGVGQFSTTGGSITFNNLPTGNYTVEEVDGPSGYHMVSNDCDVDIVNNGDQVSCTVHNAIDTGTITVHKNVDTNGDGTVDLFGVDTWTWDIDGGAQDIATGMQEAVEIGAYTISEDQQTNYHVVDLTCDGQSYGAVESGLVSVSKDQDVVCTFTNARDIGDLKIVKLDQSQQPMSGVDFTVGSDKFTTDQNGEILVSDLPTGDYTVTENEPSGYSFTSVAGTNCTNANPTTATVVPDTTTTCTFTNTRHQGTIELQKAWSGLKGTITLQIGTIAGDDDIASKYLLGTDGTTGKISVDTGTYYMSEAGSLSDYSSSPLSCFNDANDNGINDGETSVVPDKYDGVAVGNGEHIICSYTNTRNTGTVTIYKVVRGGTADSSDWTFTLHGQNGLPDVTGIKHGVPVTGVPTGFYTVSESGPAQYSFVGVYGDCSEDGSIYMDVDQDGSTCTFVNETYGIHGQKFNDVNANATWDAGEVALNGWTMFLDANLNKSLDSGEKSIVTQNHNSVDGWYWFDDLAAGSYQICEVQQAGWAQTYPVTASGCHTIELPISYEFNREGPPIIKNSSCKLSLDQSFSVMAVENSIVSEASCDFGNRLIPVTTIALDKTGPATATPGQTFTYTLEWKVNGNTAATNAVITDPLPANTTFVSQTCGTTTPTCTPSFTGNTAKWELGTRAVGTSGTVTVTVLVNPSLSASTTLNNTGTFDTDQTPPVNDSVPTTVTVPQVLGISTELGLTKSVSTPSAAPGDIVTYTLVVTNEGLGDATNVVVTDNLPDGFVFLATNKATRTWNLGTLAAGESKTLTYKVLVTPNVVAGPYVNRAFVTADFFDPLAAEALVTVKIPQVLGLATTGAGLMDYVTFVLGLALVASGVISFLKLRRRGTRTA